MDLHWFHLCISNLDSGVHGHLAGATWSWMFCAPTFDIVFVLNFNFGSLQDFFFYIVFCNSMLQVVLFDSLDLFPVSLKGSYFLLLPVLSQLN